MAHKAPKETIEERAEKQIDIKKIGAIMQKNLIVLLRDKTRIIPLIMFPIFMILVFGFTSGNIPKHISTAVVVYDASPLSQELQQEIANNQVFSVRYVVSTEGEGKHLLDNGDVRAVIIIPPHMQEDIDGGGTTGVTIMVDESDAAVAGATRQALNQVVTRMSSRISEQRLAELQQTVDTASRQLQMNAAAQPNIYGDIAEYATQADASLQQSRQLTDKGARALLLATPSSTIYTPSIAGDHAIISGDNTYVNVPPSADSTKAQAAMLERSSALVSIASLNTRTIAAIATRADKQAHAAQEYTAYERDVVKPTQAIQVFTRYKSSNLLRPLTYEEKPAYGTGKRAVDFLVPTIIALTIFQGAVMGMGRAVAGEKREGSLTRVFLTPTSNATIITGTLLFYVIFELFRAAFLISVSMLIFNVKIEGSFLLIALILIIFTGISTAIGMVLSSMVKTEPQYMAMAMLVSMPTMFLAGVFFPLQAMPKALQAIASFLPVTYAGQALRDVMIKGFGIEYIVYPLGILIIFLVVTVSMVFMAFKRDIE